MLLVETELRPSPIHGIGVFTRQFIPAGSVVWSFTPGFDLEIEEAEIERLSPPAREQFLKYSYLDVHSGKYVLCFDDSRFFNHVDEPNVKDGDSPETSHCSVAIRDIHPGEELTCDYRTFDALTRDGLVHLGAVALRNGERAGALSPPPLSGTGARVRGSPRDHSD